MVSEEEIRKMTDDFAIRCPRFMEINVRVIKGAIKASYGKDLTVTELQFFIKCLTGRLVQISIIEDALKL